MWHLCSEVEYSRGGGGGGGYSPKILVGMCRGKVNNGGLQSELERENAGLQNWL